MRSAAEEIYEVARGVCGWTRYDASVKAELSSTGLLISNGLWVVDPISLAAGAFRTLTAHYPVRAVVVTNENHDRDALVFAEKFTVPIFASPRPIAAVTSLPVTAVSDGDKLADGLTVIAIPGAGAGEIALHHDADNGTLVMGDALINFEPHGFDLLPAKYCSDSKQLRKSLAKLLDYSFERMVFAHGTPIMSSARARLEALLRSELR